MNSYYVNTDSSRDVIDLVKDFDLNFNLGNVLKYIVRAGKKDPTKYTEDLRKAVVYLQREIASIDYVELTTTEDGDGPDENLPLSLEPADYFAVIATANSLKRDDPTLREGQSLMIALYKINKDTYSFITNTEVDPFFDDNIIDDFIEVISPWEKSGS